MPSGALQEGSPFSYACQRCGRCCVGKRIQVNPYEIARLARRLGITAAEVRARYTQDGAGVVLDQDERDACVFLGPEGCTVHPDRPLVCRLYPLGRHIEESGRVSFSHVDLEPPPGGLFGTAGKVSEFLEGQGAAPFIAAADAYFAWYCAATHALAATAGNAVDADGDGADLLDLDAAVERHCAEKGEEPPHDLEQRLRLHLELLHARLDSAGGEAGL
jgi:hypothetical protein